MACSVKVLLKDCKMEGCKRGGCKLTLTECNNLPKCSQSLWPRILMLTKVQAFDRHLQTSSHVSGLSTTLQTVELRYVGFDTHSQKTNSAPRHTGDGQHRLPMQPSRYPVEALYYVGRQPDVLQFLISRTHLLQFLLVLTIR